MLLNVRLGAEDEKIVRGLRRARVNISELVRRAIRQTAADLPRPGKRASVIAEIIRAHPDGEASRRPALDDRRAVASAIRRQLRKKK